MSKKQQIICSSLSDLDHAAQALIEAYPEQKIFAFYGKMGAGKTTFIQHICKKLKVKEKVVSPTFSIINEYTAANGQKVYHFDFYRVKTQEEIFDLGYEEYFFSGSYCFIEWPDRFEKLFPEKFVYVTIEENPLSHQRNIQF